MLGTSVDLDRPAAKVPKHVQIWSITGRGGSDGFAFTLPLGLGEPQSCLVRLAGLGKGEKGSRGGKGGWGVDRSYCRSWHSKPHARTLQ